MKKIKFKILSAIIITCYLLLVTVSLTYASTLEDIGLVPCGNCVAWGPDGGCTEIDVCTVCDFFVLIKNIVDFLTEYVAMPVAVIILIYGGVMMITAGGSEEKINKGKRALWQAVWGLIIVFAAWLIIDTIIKWLGTGGQGMIENWGPWNKIPSCG